MGISARLEGVLLRIPESNWLEQVLRVSPPSYRLAAWEHRRMLHRKVSKYMGLHPKIGITGLPRSGKSAVMEKVVMMLEGERSSELTGRGEDSSNHRIIGGMKTIPIMDGTSRIGYSCMNIQTGEVATIAHKDIDSRNRVLGLGINPQALDDVAVPAIQDAMDNYEVIVIDEIGKFSVESEAFVEIVKEAIEVDKPTILTLHKKSRHPLLQDIRRRDDARVLEVTPVNRALLPYKIHKIVRETF